MLKNWAIYRYEGEGKMRYLGVISATGQDDAHLESRQAATRGRPSGTLR
jgi:hypothetical protein